MSVDGPCTLERAVETIAVAGEEVIVNPGTYNAADVQINKAISVHGVTGQARPQIVGGTAGLDVIAGGAGASVRYLRLTGFMGVRISVNATFDQVIAQGASSGCVVIPSAPAGVTISNSVCLAATGFRGIDYEALSAFADTLTLRNVSAFAPDTGSGGFGIFLLANAATANLTVDAKNVIADGATDVGATGTGISTANMSFSNYATRVPVPPPATDDFVTDPTTNNNQTTPPVFADADLHQAASSPTVNAGSAVDTVGLFDVDGGMRTVGAAPDIGADECGATGCPVFPVPASAPSNGFTVGGLKGKKLTLTLDSAGGVEVADGGGKKLKPSSATGGPGAVEVTLKLSKAAKQRLKLKGKVTVQASITFTPTGGTAKSVTQKLKIKSK